MSGYREDAAVLLFIAPTHPPAPLRFSSVLLATASCVSMHTSHNGTVALQANVVPLEIAADTHGDVSVWKRLLDCSGDGCVADL